MLPEVHGPQKKTAARSPLGMVLSQSATLQRVAEAMARHGIREAKMHSIQRRFARVVATECVQVSKSWRQFLMQVLAWWKGKLVQFGGDGPLCDGRATIVDLELLVHSQASPVMWQIMPVYDQWGLVGELVDDVSRHLEPTDGPLIADRGLLVQLLPWSVVSRSACYDWMAHLQCVRERVLGW